MKWESKMVDIKNSFVKKDFTLKATMDKISKAAREGLPGGIALVVDEDEKLIGVITDGDIRRALLKGFSLEDSIEEIFIKDPIVFSDHQSYREILSDIPKKIKEKKRYRKGIIEKIIIVDKEGRPKELYDFYEIWIKQEVLHKKVCVLGLGFVGFTLALSLADVGFSVIGIEKDEKIKEEILNGSSHFYEPGIDTLLKYHLKKNFFVEDKILPDCDIFIISVGTPLNSRKEADMEPLRVACEEVGKYLKYGDLVILRSTVPVGCSRNFVLPILEKQSNLKAGKDFYLSFAPERTIEGKALYELRNLPQVIGGYDQNSTDMTAKFFRELTPSIVTVDSLEEAEFIKLLNNSFRDLIFSFANEFSLICEKYNLNATKIISAANEGYPRDRIPIPSPGVGGYCLTKDPYFYIKAGKEAGLDLMLSSLGRKINERIPEIIFKKINRVVKEIGKGIEKCKIFIIGFAFKGEPETSDMRSSTTIDLINHFRDVNNNIYGYDPVVEKEEIEKFGVKYCKLEEGFKEADIAIFMNNHRSYITLDIFDLLESMKKPAILCDYWYLFPSKMVKQVEGIIHVVPGMVL